MLKQTINKIRKNARSFVLNCRYFGFNVALWSFLSKHQTRIIVLSKEIRELKHQSIKTYLFNNYSEIIDKYAKRPTGELIAMDGESPIWICWWDGKEAMPDIVKMCFRSVCANAAGHPVILVTKHNYREHVTLPNYICEKVKIGAITITHLSDILRMCLLSQRGGLWVDATLMMTKPLPTFQNSGFFTIKHINDGTYVSECRWTGFCIGGNKGNVLFDYMTDMLFQYWKKEDALIDYLLVDYLIAVACESVCSIKEMIDNNPFSNTQLYGIRHKLDAEFDRALLEKICADTYFHKLTWKASFQTTTLNGKTTLYGHLMSKQT